MKLLRNPHLFALDAVLLTITPFFVYALGSEGWAWNSVHTRAVLVFVALMVPARLLVYAAFGIYNRLWRYASLGELELIVIAAIGGSVISFALGGWVLPGAGLMPDRIPLSLLFTTSLLSFATLAAPRLFLRMGGSRGVRQSLNGTEPRVLIVGAGAAGQMVLRELQANPSLELVPVGFVDDDPGKQHMKVGNLPIFGSLAETESIIREQRIKHVIMAMPNAPGAAIRQVIRAALDAGAETRTVPSLREILAGQRRPDALRDVKIEDLLRREPIETDMGTVSRLARDRVVLVTGAGGSIGSELSRQIAALGPGRLLLLGHSENPIFEILNELRRKHPGLMITPVIADIRDEQRMRQVFEKEQPFAVFHAAAHKHVPMMEENVIEAVTNNVLGTKNVVDLSVATGVAHLVCISTDKAVHPTHVMGATKRVAEYVVLHSAMTHGRNFVSVRFGNVLGSRGSVVPTFMRQIEDGGPVTVTHPDMRRNFMTIPEAVQLVLQAGALGKGGELFMLDMGEPVKVVDLAHDLIRLSGLEEGKNIEIQFSGVRPGEQLFDETYSGEEPPEHTDHPKVLRGRRATVESWRAQRIDELIRSAVDGERGGNLLRMLQGIVPDFAPDLAALARETPSIGVEAINVPGVRQRRR